MIGNVVARKWSRRQVLAGLTTVGAVAAAGGLIAACGAPSATPAAKQNSAPTTPAGAAQPAATAGKTSAPATAVPPATAKASSDAVTLRIHMRTGSEEAFFKERLDAFTKSNPKVVVKQEPFATAEYWQKVWTMLAGGTLGDVIWTQAKNSNHYFSASNGTIQPLDSYIQGEKFDLSAYYPKSVQVGKFEGKVFGLPFKLPLGNNALFYNEDLFKAAGLPLPTNDWKWDDLLSNAQKLTKDTTKSGKIDQFGYMPAMAEWSQFRHYANAFGGELINEEGKKSLISTPEVQKGMQYIYDLINTHKVSPQPSQVMGSTDQMFVSGKVAMYQAGTFTKTIGLLIKDKFQWSGVMMPKGPSGMRIGEVRCDYVGLTSNTKFGDQGWQVVKWLTDKESGIRLGEGAGGQSGTCGARPDVFTSERLLKNPAYKPEVHQLFLTTMEEGLLPAFRDAANFRGNEMEKALLNGLDPLWIGKAQPTTAMLDEVSKSVQKVLDQPRP